MPESARARALRVSPYLLLTLTALFWSGNFVVGRAVHGVVPPVAMSFWRWVVAGLILLPFAVPRMLAQRDTIAASWRRLAGLAALSVASFNTLAYIGLQYTSATNGVLLNSVIPVLIILISRVFLAEPIGKRRALGVAISLAGVLVIVGRGDPMRLAALSFNAGDLWVLAAVTTWAVYTVSLRWRPPGLHALAFLGSLVAFGLLWLAPLYALELAGGRSSELTSTTAAALVYVGLFPSVLAYVFWNRAVAQVGAPKAGMFIHLMPVFGTLLAIAFLGERFQLFHAAGIALIFGGIRLSTWPR